MPATAPTSSRCGWPARPMKRLRGPAAASSRRSRRCVRRARTSSCAQSLPRLDALIAEGVTTIEIKSGYGLDLDNEAKSLRAARRLGEERPVAVRTTFLGAHALPPEAKATRTPSSTRVASEMLPAIAARRPGRRGRRLLRGHRLFARADRARFRRGQGARPAGEAACRPAVQPAWRRARRALSARCRPIISNIPTRPAPRRWPRPGTVAVILPGAFYFIRETKKPPVELFRRHGVRMAVATDCNPGTSPLTSLLLTMNMAATLFGMTVEECLAGVTREAARALGLLGRDRHARGRQIGRPRDLGHRAPGRTRLPHGLQPAACPHLEGSVTEFVLKPGSASLADWRAIYRGAVPVLDPACKPRSARSAEAVARIVAQGRAGLRHQHRLRQAGQRAHRGRRSRNPAAQHRPLACRRRRRADAGRRRAADDGAEARQPGAGRLRRAAGDARAAGSDAGQGRHPGRARRKARSAPPAISRRWRT